MVTHNSILSPQEAAAPTADFWQDGYICNAQPFSEQLAALDSYPRDTMITSSRLNEQRQSEIRIFTEEDGMRDLQTYIHDTKDALEIRDPETGPALTFLRQFEKRFTFLGTPEYKLASGGVARAISEHLAADSDRVVNIVDMTVDTLGGPETSYHSYHKVAEDVVGQIDPKVAERIRCKLKDWENSPKATLIGMDDWIIGGATAEAIADRARRQAREANMPELFENTFELHLLMASANKLGRQNLRCWSSRPPLYGMVRSFYKAPDAHETHWNGYGTFLSGAHSSVDYDFDAAFSKIAEVLQRHKQGRPTPLLAYIHSTYSDKYSE
jgi:hypothetical protein